GAIPRVRGREGEIEHDGSYLSYDNPQDLAGAWEVLYYVAGWLLSRVWSHSRRHNMTDQEWDFIVQHNHSPSSAGAIERDPILNAMVGEVDARNDPVDGAGLLFPTLAWYEFVFHAENGIYHFLR
ncbi:unnamed protein product, partial [Pylaiella littoralis]